MNAPRLLFVPVSGEKGVGEYYRLLAIAEGVQRRWPRARIHFVISRFAGYANDVPFPTVKIEGSPTFHTSAVRRAIGGLRPQVVVFDSGGRVAQLRDARRVGARTVYVSSRRKARWRGFRLRRMRYLDQHWLAWPRFLEGELTRWERLKLRVFASIRVVYLDSVYPPPDTARAADYCERLGLGGRRYALFCAGGGGYEHDGVPAPEIFARAAAQVCREAHLAAVWVRGPNYAGSVDPGTGVVSLGAVSATAMVDLLSSAGLGVINGGSLLLQALALKLPCVAAPVADDQAARIEACARRGLVVPAGLDSQELAVAALELLRSEGRLREIQQRVAALDLRNGVDQAVEALAGLLAGEGG